MLFTVGVIFTSFLVGFAMKRGGLCTYAAVLQIVHHKRLERMLVFLGAAAWAALVVLPLAWLWPDWIALAKTHHYFGLALAGGAILGVGAFLNKGCFFGTFVQLVGGNLNYLATLLGLSAGVMLSQRYLQNQLPTGLTPTTIGKPGTLSLIWFSIMAGFALFMAISVKLNGTGFIKKVAGLGHLSWQSSFAMIVIGIGGGLLYATVNGWNYADVLSNGITTLVKDNASAPTAIAIISTTAMVTGGIVAAITANEFAIKPAKPVIIASCFFGGLLMGIAALLTPLAAMTDYSSKASPALHPTHLQDTWQWSLLCWGWFMALGGISRHSNSPARLL